MRRVPLLLSLLLPLAVSLPAHAASFFDDFDDLRADGWEVVGGVWGAINGDYVGEGMDRLPKETPRPSSKRSGRRTPWFR
jgi:hypothetical protein